MDMRILIDYNKRENELSDIRKSLEDLLNEAELKKYKEEYLRLKADYEKCEESIHGHMAQIDIKQKEINNLMLEKESCEIIKNSDEISSKKQDKIGDQIKKINEKISIAKAQVIKLEKETENINKDTIELKKKMHYIKNKYNEKKEKKQNQLNELKSIEKRLIEEMEVLYGSVGSEAMDIYVKVKRTHKNPVAIVESKICTGCNMEISSIGYEAVKYVESIARCENCGRILVIV